VHARSALRISRGDRIAIAVLLGVPLVVFAVPALLGYPLLTGDDVIQSFPLKALVGEMLRRGELPVYNPFDWAGTPLLGSMNAGAAFPTVVLFALLPPLPAWVLTEAGAFGAAALGIYVLCRASQLGPLASGLGATCFGFGGFLSSQAVHLDVVEAGASLAWVLVGLERTARGPTRHRGRWMAATAAAGGCVGLSGSPEASAYCLVAAFTFGAHLLLHERGDRTRLAARYACCTLVAGLLAAVQVLPGADVVASSQRAHVGSGLLHAGSLDASQLLTLLVPHLLGGGPIGLRSYVGSYNLAEIDAYAGIASLVAVSALATQWRAPGASAWRVWYVVGAIGLVAALGDHTPLASALAHLPVLGASRLPSRALLLYALGSALVLAHWTDHWLAIDRVERHARISREAIAGALLPAAVVVTVLAVAIGGRRIAGLLAGGPVGPWSVGAVAPYLAVCLLLALAAGATSLAGARLSRTARRRVLLVLVLTDTLVFTADQSSLAPVYASALEHPNALSRRLARLVGPTGRFVVADASRSGGTTLDRLGAPDLNALGGPASAQGYGSLVWGPYAQQTGTHGQDVVAASAVAGSVLDSLSVRVLLVTPASFEEPTRGGALSPPSDVTLGSGAPTVRYFGGAVAIDSVTLRLPGTIGPASSDALALARSLRLLGTDGRTEIRSPGGVGRPRPVSGHALRVVLATPSTASGLVLTAPRGLGRERIGITVERVGGSSFSPTGPLASAAVPPHWQLSGTFGPYAVLRDSRAAPPLAATGAAPGAVSFVARPATRAAGTAGPTTSADGAWSSPARIDVDARAPFSLVRSVADIPGWTATVDDRGRPRAVAIRRHGLVQAVVLPRGHYMVTFSYDAPGARRGGEASLAGLVGLLGLAVAGGTRSGLGETRDSVLLRRRRATRARHRLDDGAGGQSNGSPSCSHGR